MLFLCQRTALAAVILWLCCCVQSSSLPTKPLHTIDHPSTTSLEILPRRVNSTYAQRRSLPMDALLASDSFRLSLQAFDREFHLHMRPNTHLIHPAARIKQYHSDGSFIYRPLIPDSILAYYGEVVDADDSEWRMREDAAGLFKSQKLDLDRGDVGWARLVVHDPGDAVAGRPPEYEGAFTAHGDTYHIMTTDNYNRNKLDSDPDVVDFHEGLVIWRDSDVVKAHHAPPTCGHDSLLHDPSTFSIDSFDPFSEINMDLPIHFNSSLNKRDDVAGMRSGQNFQNSIGNTAGCPSAQKILYLGVAADCSYVKQYGSIQNATNQILTVFNSASALYKNTFNVSLGIIELQIKDPNCPASAPADAPWNVDCQSNVSLNDRLSLFSAWRGNKGNDGAGMWHLMSACPTGSEVGIAWLGTICQQTASGSAPNVVSATAVSTAGRTEWQVVSHETGHVFGAIHDCDSSCGGSNSTTCCPLSKDTCNADSKFLMSPVAETGEMNFSQCSIGNICSLMLENTPGKTNTTCFVDPSVPPPKQLISLNMCGNGIVESGEDCDPGQGVTSSCCDSSTCKFINGAKCDPHNSQCCTDQCTLAPSTQVCRPAKDAECDIAEMCTGSSPTCPQDITKPNGQMCGNTSGLACASGLCTSNDLQCKMMGTSLNIQKACPTNNDNSCEVSCQNPNDSTKCFLLQSTFVDGSPCGYGGSCAGGRCQPGSPLNTAVSWFKQNLQIAIPVSVVVGLIVLVLLYWLISVLIGCCSDGRRSRPSPGMHQRLGSTSSIPMPPPPPPKAPLQTTYMPAPPPARMAPNRYNENNDYARMPPSNFAAGTPPLPTSGSRMSQPYATSQPRPYTRY